MENGKKVGRPRLPDYALSNAAKRMRATRARAAAAKAAPAPAGTGTCPVCGLKVAETIANGYLDGESGFCANSLFAVGYCVMDVHVEEAIAAGHSEAELEEAERAGYVALGVKPVGVCEVCGRAEVPGESYVTSKVGTWCPESIRRRGAEPWYRGVPEVEAAIAAHEGRR